MAPLRLWEQTLLRPSPWHSLAFLPVTPSVIRQVKELGPPIRTFPLLIYRWTTPQNFPGIPFGLCLALSIVNVRSFYKMFLLLDTLIPRSFPASLSVIRLVVLRPVTTCPCNVLSLLFTTSRGLVPALVVTHNSPYVSAVNNSIYHSPQSKPDNHLGHTNT